MTSLEQLVKQECRFESLVFYSVSNLPPILPSEPSMPLESISSYADSLNRQFGVPSPSVSPTTPSSSVGIETFDSEKVLESLNQHYNPSVNEEEIAYATNLNQQFNTPSPVVTPVTSHAPTLNTFDFVPVLDAVNNPFTVSSSPANPVDAPLYDPPGFNTPDFIIPKFENINILGYKGGLSRKDDILDSKPFKYYEDFRKNEIKILTKGICTKSDFHDALDLFKNNELPNIFEKIKQNLNMKQESVTAIILTNPLHMKNSDEEGPNFLEYDNGDREIHLPVTQPKFIPFVKTDKQEYRDIVLNSFLPHEQAHANINEKYGNIAESEGLIGFNEHLANTMAKDSLGQSYVNAETEYQNMWAGNSENKSHMTKNYSNYLLDEDASKVPANIATVNILENSWLKKKTDNILNNALEKLYPNDEKFKENVSNNIYELSNTYQKEAFKITELSKKDTILSNFKVRRILSEVEKKTFRFLEEL